MCKWKESRSCCLCFSPEVRRQNSRISGKKKGTEIGWGNEQEARAVKMESGKKRWGGVYKIPLPHKFLYGVCWCGVKDQTKGGRASKLRGRMETTTIHESLVSPHLLYLIPVGAYHEIKKFEQLRHLG